MNWINYTKKVNLRLGIGLLLIIAAFAIWLFSFIELRSNEIMLTTQLSIEEVWRYEGALQWWKAAYNTAIIPATAILSFSGIAALLSKPILNNFRQKDVMSRFEQKIKKTCLK
jgi:hypothetical protein